MSFFQAKSLYFTFSYIYTNNFCYLLPDADNVLSHLKVDIFFFQVLKSVMWRTDLLSKKSMIMWLSSMLVKKKHVWFSLKTLKWGVVLYSSASASSVMCWKPVEEDCRNSQQKVGSWLWPSCVLSMNRLGLLDVN